MNIVGVIAEYNPLHNGHIYHLNEAKKIAGADAVIVAMSGNFVQRGEPAILDKWERSELAVLNGADLVIEIPTVFSLGNARQYSRAAVMLLESLGCVSHLAFGSESGDINQLKEIADNIKHLPDTEISEYYKRGYTYPKAREITYKMIYGDDAPFINGSNDVLAVEYINYCKSIKPIAIKRLGAGYSENSICDNSFQSATAIRNAVYNGVSIKDFVPNNVYERITKCINNSNEVFKLLKYVIISSSSDEIDSCISGDKGIGNRMKEIIVSTNDLDSFIQSVKTKNLTYSRISRLCMQLLLNIKNINYTPEYIRLLALNGKGRKIISYIENKEINSLPIITNINKSQSSLSKEAINMLEIDTRAMDVYNLISNRNTYSYSDYVKHPFILE